ncbi:MAG: hypothetical protein ACRENA_14480, partial [Vulcanimicrobiaceae bacterium]
MAGSYGGRVFRVLAVLGSVTALTACGGGGSSVSGASGAQSGAFTSQQMNDISYSALHEFVSGMETGVSSLSVDQRSAQSDPCTAVSPSPPVINADGIPANETYVHSDCKDLPWAVGESVSGQVNIKDTSRNAQNLSYTQTDTNLSVSGNDNGTPFTVVRNGNRFVGSTGNGQTFSVTRLIVAVRTTPNSTLNIADNWESHFTADPQQNVVLLEKLPAGKFDEAHGSATYVNASISVTVNFSITQPLHFDPTCT